MKPIALLKYDRTDGNWKPSEFEVSPSTLARSMSHENFSETWQEFLNIGMKDYNDGVAIGKLLHSAHRTIQGSIVRFCLGVLEGLSKQVYTDARNEIPIDTARKITAMVTEGILKKGWMI